MRLRTNGTKVMEHVSLFRLQSALEVEPGVRASYYDYFLLVVSGAESWDFENTSRSWAMHGDFEMVFLFTLLLPGGVSPTSNSAEFHECFFDAGCIVAFVNDENIIAIDGKKLQHSTWQSRPQGRFCHWVRSQQCWSGPSGRSVG